MSGPAPAERPQGDLGPYEAMIRHAELELELAGRGELEGLEALGERWEQLVAAAPSSPPPAAAPLLERARLIHERTRIDLERLREALLSDVSTATRASRAAAGYGGHLHPAAPQVERSA